jgi:hypothetical protein
MATWNVLSLFRVDAMRGLMVELMRYNIKIAAIQEMRWKGKDMMDIDEYMICYSGSNDRNTLGTGFLIHKSLKSAIMNFVPINERLCILRLRGKFCNISILCIHAPT